VFIRPPERIGPGLRHPAARDRVVHLIGEYQERVPNVSCR
jgi:hypothetical protein